MERKNYLRPTAFFLFLLIFSTIVLIQFGLFDPKPIGTRQHILLLEPLTIPAGSQQLVWLEIPPLPANFSARLTAVFQSGDPDNGYGILLGTPNAYIAIAVSPLGLFSIWEQSVNASITHQPIHPWQPWPHIALNNAPNEIWLDVASDQLTVRLNREWLWAGEWSMNGAGEAVKLGLVGVGFGETAVVDFQQLELFWE